MASLFLSYSRRDIEIARRLAEAFERQKLDFWIDWAGIPPTVDWWKEIEKGIEEADIFLFLISPDSVKSKYCKQEIKHAVKNGKRLIPIVVRDIQAEESPSELSPLNWIFFRENDDFNNSLGKLITAIKTDYEWVQAHRQLQVKALEWERNNHENSFLLRGKELQDAELELATNSSKEPYPIDLQREYVLRSRQAADNQRTVVTGIGIAVAIALAALAVFGLVQAGRATANAQTAVANEAEAKQQASIALARQFAAESAEALDRDEELSLRRAIQAINATYVTSKTYTAEAQRALYRALHETRLRRVLESDTESVWSASFSPDGHRIVTVSSDNTAHVWDREGNLLMTLEHPNGVWLAIFSPDGQNILTGDDHGKLRLWDTEGSLLNTFDGHTNRVYRASFSPDGDRILTAGFDGTVRLWNKDGTPLKILLNDVEEVMSASFSSNGNYMLTASSDATAQLWEGDIVRLWDKEGNLLLSHNEPNYPLQTAIFSPDSSTILIRNREITQLWNIETDSFIHVDSISDQPISFSPDGSRILAAGGTDETAKLWDGNGRLLAILEGHTNSVSDAIFSPDGNLILTGSSDGTARLWDKTGTYLATLQGHTERIADIAFSPDGRSVLTSSEDQTVRLWDVDGSLLTVLEGEMGIVNSAIFSSDGSRIITIDCKALDDDRHANMYGPLCSDGMARLWNEDGSLLVALEDHSTETVVARFSPDGSRIFTVRCDTSFGYRAPSSCIQETVRLWDKNGVLLAVLEENTGLFSFIDFSADSSRIIISHWNDLFLWDRDGRYITQLDELNDQNQILVALNSADSQILTAERDLLRMWDKNGALITSIKMTEYVNRLIVSPDGSRILIHRGTTAELRSGDGTLLATFEGDIGPYGAMAFSPDNAHILTADKGIVHIWNADGASLNHIKIDGGIQSAIFSPDGSRVLVSNWFSSMLISIADGGMIASLDGDTPIYSPDGSRILTIDGNTVIISDRNGAFITTINGHTDTVASATFSPDGKRILTTSWDGTARLWEYPYSTVESMLDEATKRVLPLLSEEECQEVFVKSCTTVVEELHN